MNTAILNVNGILKPSTEISYDDLVWLYKDYIDKYHKVPTTADGVAKNNLPQGRIIKRILEKEKITMNDFLNQFGKVSHVRTESKDYDFFVTRYKEISIKNGKALFSNQLINNSYGLPNPTWFVKYCPDKSVKTFDDFVQWCGFSSNKQTKNKDIVVQSLYELEKKLNRPIIKQDIRKDTVGFSMIVINRIWGGLNNCKKELGLLSTLPTQPKPFEEYKAKLDLILDNFEQNHDRNNICWKDIENNPITNVEHKSLSKAFRRQGLDVVAYIKSRGFDMNPSLFSFHNTFEDGEITVSSFEYDFSKYLRQCGYVYNQSYLRNVMYKTMIPNVSSKINCDYVINGYWIEIAGIISNVNNNWENHIYSSKQEQNYQRKLIKKKNLLESNKIPYIFLFPEDFKDDTYKKVIDSIIRKEAVYA